MSEGAGPRPTYNTWITDAVIYTDNQSLLKAYTRPILKKSTVMWIPAHHKIADNVFAK